MRSSARAAVICGAGMLFATSSATVVAQPPQSCARKFIGTWGWTSSTGIYTTQNFQADGSAVCSGNAFCVGGATWTCNGNQLTYNNGMYDTVLTLSAGATKMTGTGGLPSNLQTVVRVGAAAPAPHVAAAQPAPRVAAASNQGDCSDITGAGLTGGGGNCAKIGHTAAALANKYQRSNPAAAAEYYRAAAEAYRRAKMYDASNRMSQGLAGLMASLPANGRSPTFSHSPAPPTCSGLASTQLVLTNGRIHGGWYTYHLKNTAQCSVCFTFKTCDNGGNGAKCVEDPKHSLGPKGSASSWEDNQSYQFAASVSNVTFCGGYPSH
jgi:hypothetical protein